MNSIVLTLLQGIGIYLVYLAAAYWLVRSLIIEVTPAVFFLVVFGTSTVLSYFLIAHYAWAPVWTVLGTAVFGGLMGMATYALLKHLLPVDPNLPPNVEVDEIDKP
jgi:hypothetical protein